jgi:DNA-binding NtrC family response regulator
MLTGSDDINIAIQAIKDGANDFIVKPPEPSQLDVTIKNAIKLATLSREFAKLKRDKEGALVFSDLIGYNTGLSTVVSFGRKAAACDVPVLIAGETGVGKELFARAIHGESKRMGAPFIAINCGAIPENLVESTLFGHEKGSFTGAINRTIGKFREAEGGTIFLDEIGELPLEAQVKLLRVLQQKEVEPVGAGKTTKVNVRVISATNRDLRREVQAGRFREDLYFRLNVLPITVPPLRERAQDILPLAEYFIQHISMADGLPLKKLARDAKEYIKNSNWTGNVRELENLIHRSLVLSDNEVIDSVTLANIHEINSSSEPVERRSSAELTINLRLPNGNFKTMADIETEAINIALNYFENNITKAANALNIAKSTFYRKIKD